MANKHVRKSTLNYNEIKIKTLVFYIKLAKTQKKMKIQLHGWSWLNIYSHAL